MNKVKHQMGEKIQTVTIPKNLEDMKISAPCICFNEIQGNGLKLKDILFLNVIQLWNNSRPKSRIQHHGKQGL